MSNQNNSKYSGMTYLKEVATELLKKIGLLEDDDKKLTSGCGLAIRFEESPRFPGNNNGLTKTFHFYSQNREKQLTVCFDIFQSQITHASTVHLISHVADILISYLSGTTLEDFAGKHFCFTTILNESLTAKMAAENLYREMVFGLATEWEKLIHVSFEVLDKISLTRYEGAKSKGKLAFSVCTNSNVLCQQCDWTLEETALADVDHVRLLRKLLAGTGKDCALAFFADPQADPYMSPATCVGVISENKAQSFCPVTVKLDGPMNWKFCYQNEVLFQRTHNGYQIDKSDIRLKLEHTIKRIFGINYSNSQLKKTLDRIKSKHGAAIIIADFNNAKQIQKRLKKLHQDKKAMAVNFSQDIYQNAALDTAIENISSAAAMDGAVVIDLQGRIRYVAVILDGRSKVVGDLSRGARYNSIKNFVYSLNDLVIGIVLSEDGGADIIYKEKKA